MAGRELGEREPGSVPRTLPERLSVLFETVRPAGKPRYTFRQVADAIRTEQGVAVSAQYIQQIATGERRNPGVAQVSALERFFGVPRGWLYGLGSADDVATDGGDEQVFGELQRLRELIRFREGIDAAMDETLRDPQVQDMVIRARGVSPQHLQLVLRVLNEVRQIEGLKEPTDEGQNR